MTNSIVGTGRNTSVAGYLFNGYSIDLDSQRLFDSEGNHLHVRSKTLDVLIYLIENRTSLVGKQELLTKIWRNMIVEDQAVFQSISEIRALLGRSDCIRTVKGRGYQWVLETREQPVQFAQQGEAVRSFGERIPARIVLGVMACLIAGYAFLVIDFENHAAANESKTDALLSSQVPTEVIPAHALLMEAQSHMTNARYEEAKARIDTVLAYFPEHPRARLDRAYLFKLMGHGNEAKRLAEEVYRMTNTLDESETRLGAALLLSEISLANRELLEARSLGEEALNDAIGLDNEVWIAASLEQLANIALVSDDIGMAAARLQGALVMYGGECPGSVERVRDKLTVLASNQT